NSVCDACQRGKSHQLPYHASSRVSTMPLELIHTDVWGPALPSSGGYKYYVSFINDYSCFYWIYLIKFKADVEPVFYAFQTHVERLLNAKIKSVQSDWGGASIIASTSIFSASASLIECLVLICLSKTGLLNASIVTLSKQG